MSDGGPANGADMSKNHQKLAPTAQLHQQLTNTNLQDEDEQVTSADGPASPTFNVECVDGERDVDADDNGECDDRMFYLPPRASYPHNGVPLRRYGPGVVSPNSIHGEAAVVEDSASRRSYKPRQSSMNRRYKKTACFVHSLLEVQQQRNNIASEPGSPRPTSPTNSATGLGYTNGHYINGEPKKDLFTHLSKKEISDMALGVRELSKRLASARLKLNIHHILIVTKTSDKALIGMTRDLTAWLLSLTKDIKETKKKEESYGGEFRRHGYTIYVQDVLQKEKDFELSKLQNGGYPGKLKFWDADLCTRSPQLFDFVITLGGDGTVLYTSWLFQQIVPPVLSFALGSLGFLTLFDYEKFREVILSVFNDGVNAALRMRIECTIYRAARDEHGDLIDPDRDLHQDIIRVDHAGEDDQASHHSKDTFSVLNDLVVDRGPNPFMSSTELYGDDEHLTSIAADGVCISTPTGSTAYSLAAGGSLCHPEIPAILISPICPHTLSFRPLLVPDSMVLRVAVPYDSRSTAWVSFDGRNRTELKQGDYVRISASRFPFPICLRTKQTADWFEVFSFG